MTSGITLRFRLFVCLLRSPLNGGPTESSRFQGSGSTEGKRRTVNKTENGTPKININRPPTPTIHERDRTVEQIFPFS